MEKKKSTKKIIIYIFLGIVLYSALMQTEKVLAIWDSVKSMLSPFVVGGVIAFILNVPMRLFEKMFKGVKSFAVRRTLAITVTLIFVSLIFVGVGMLLVPAVIETVGDLVPILKKFFKEDLVNGVNALLTKYPQIKDKLSAYVSDGVDWGSLIPQAMNVVGNSLEAFWTGITSVISFLSTFLMNAFVTVVFTVYCLSQKEVLARQGRKLLYAYLPEKYADEIIRIARLTNSTFSNFLSGQCLEVVILGLMFAISMWILDMSYVPLISVLIAVTAFIPIVGAWIGCVVGAFLLLVTDPMQAVWFVVLFLVLQQIENHLIYPKVVGNSIGLSGMWVLIAIAVGGAVFGVAGMFLMIPFASVIQTILREIVHKRLEKRPVDIEKLTPQPPILKSQLRENREVNKLKRQTRRAERTKVQKK